MGQAKAKSPIVLRNSSVLIGRDSEEKQQEIIHQGADVYRITAEIEFNLNDEAEVSLLLETLNPKITLEL